MLYEVITVYWFDTEEELIDKRNRFENEGSNINFCGKIKVQMEYCSTRNELVFV